MPVEKSMIGMSISDAVLAFQNSSIRYVVRSRGDMATLIRNALAEMHTREILTGEDKETLDKCFSEALNVLAGKADAKKTLSTIRKRYAAMVASRHVGEVACALADLCQSVVSDQIDASAKDDDEVRVRAVSASTKLGGKGEQALFWGVMGGLVGGGVTGGPIGAVIGAAVGAAVGACGDGDTTITVTNNGA